MTNRRPAPITAYDWQDYSCGFTCPHCGERDVILGASDEPRECSCCGMRYWLEVRVMEEPPEMDVASAEEES